MSDTPTPAPDMRGEIIGRMKAKIKELARKLQERTDAAAAAHKELDEARKGDQSGRVKELEGELRTLRHRGAFDRLAKERGAVDEALDDLFALSGYRAEGDEPDEKAIGRLLDDQAAHPARGRFFAPAPAEGEGEAEGRAEAAAKGREPAPDAGRGRPAGNGTVFVTREQLADPRWALDPKNAELKRTARIR